MSTPADTAVQPQAPIPWYVYRSRRVVSGRGRGLTFAKLAVAYSALSL
jgi:hypothetical protein